ncbi:hypothetical protein VPH35_026706 [Triticum aestivum]
MPTTQLMQRASDQLFFLPFVLITSAKGTDAEVKRFKANKSSDENGSFRKGVEADSRSASKVVDQNTPPPKQDFIQVRARRGQATDSHILAERVSSMHSFHFYSRRP